MLKKAFTLVELIVVITILAILGTIAFISFQGYSASARDSKRISDIQNIKKSLELFSINTGKFPIADNGYNATFSGTTIRIQGNIGDNIAKNLSRNLQSKPLDPLTGLEYTYSATISQTEYEVLALYESDIISYNKYNFFNKANAVNYFYPKIEGTYNGVAVKTSKYIIPTPSIINAQLIDNSIELDQINITSQIISGGDNLYNNGNIINQTGILDINFSYYEIPDSGLINNVELLNVILDTYTGSSIISDGIYKTLFSTTDINDLVSLVNQVVLNPVINSSSQVNELNCYGGKILGNVYDTIEYSYLQIESGETKTGTGNEVILNGTKQYLGDITCINGISTISNERLNNTICDMNYSYNGTSCNANTQTSSCLGTIPTNASATTSTTYEQSWNGTTWIPTSTWGENQSTCDFNCNSGYSWNGTACIVINPFSPCTASKQVYDAPSTYPGCGSPDIVICSGVGVGYVIAACNIGASTASSDHNISTGYYFQRGNNFGSTSGSATSTTLANASGYGPGNYYSSTSFIIGQGTYRSGNYDWSSVRNDNLWGNTTNTYEARRGPCAEGYYVPKQSQWSSLYLLADYIKLKLPRSGYRSATTGGLSSFGSYGRYWSSQTYSNNLQGYAMYFYNLGNDTSFTGHRADGYQVRCFKN